MVVLVVFVVIFQFLQTIDTQLGLPLYFHIFAALQNLYRIAKSAALPILHKTHRTFTCACCNYANMYVQVGMISLFVLRGWLYSQNNTCQSSIFVNRYYINF
eukprot:TRINITY_DN61_c0_g5_i1.p4 TRINITY_DN61_c0_g5~~TRINITY_DN61_c0_g5_i1.p4  ORF type:complete len:102 (-),score=3.63 TRINITY_DN61_c0_g5_i1:279-584(-)